MTIKQNIQPALRPIIRKAIKKLLVDNVDVGERVYIARPSPAILEMLPCVLLYSSEEMVAHKDTAPRIYEREYSLVVEVLHAEGFTIQESYTLEDFLDWRGYEVERSILKDVDLGLGDKGSWIQDVELVGAIFARQIYDGLMNVGCLKHLFKITYDTDLFDESLFSEFLTFENSISTSSGVESEDDVTIRSS